MKLVKILITMFVALLCLGVFILGVFACDVNTLFFKIFWFVWLFISCGILPNVILTAIYKKFDKELEEIKEQQRVKGARMFLNQVSSTDRFKEITNKDLPLINVKGEKYGTTTVYNDLTDFLENEFNNFKL